MKFFVVFFAVALIGFVSAAETGFTYADKEFLNKQKKVYDLVNHVLEKTFIEEQAKYAKEYNLEANKNNFAKPEVFNDFIKFYRQGFLPKYRIFSLTYDRYRDEAIALFHMFYYAKDFDTFYRTACWARENMNEGLFVYAFTVAVLHRPDCQGIVLPAPYEIYPYYFVKSDVMDKVNFIKSQGFVLKKELPHQEGIASLKNNVAIIYNNKSVGYNDAEQRISYFTDDIGLNAYYYYFHHDYPFWMSGKDFGLDKDRRGELHYYVHQQLLARYYLERLSNGLGKVASFSWYSPIKTGFNPNTKYHNGQHMSIRPNNYDMSTEYNIEYMQEVEDYERRIRTAIDDGYITLYDGKKISLNKYEDIEYLGRFVDGNKDLGDIKFFDHVAVIAKFLLGAGTCTLDKADYLPGAIEQFQTTMRDPMFYQLYTRYMKYFFRFKKNLPAYTKNELQFQGVTINSVEFTPLTTYKEEYDFDISTGATLTKEEITEKKEKYEFYARQKRLNHKPFSVNFDITSDKDNDVSIRMFLGPKYDNYGRELNINENKYNFFELDQFTHTLKSGKNAFTRTNREFAGTAFDSTHTRILYQNVTDGQFRLDNTEAHNGWPLRLLLPKGRKSGMKYQVFVIVTPFHPAKVPYGTGFPYQYATGVGSGARYSEDLPFGFPLDRPIDVNEFFQTNMHMKDITIYHEYNR